jgi:hypothetical protein
MRFEGATVRLSFFGVLLVDKTRADLAAAMAWCGNSRFGLSKAQVHGMMSKNC